MQSYPEDLAGTAVQIVFEYPDWTDEHVSDMWQAVLASGEETGEWNEADLQEVTQEAQNLKDKGYDFDKVYNILRGGEEDMSEEKRIDPMEGKEKPTVKLIGEDGNAFAILGKVKNALRKAGYKEEAETYLKEAMSGDYDHLLATTMKYVDVL